MEGKQKVALTFALYQNDTLVRRETVTQDIVKVGKDAKSHVRVDDELASRMHAVIEVASTEDITLIDLGNDPGTMVNGSRVNKCKISVGDQLEIGSTRIVLERAEAVAVASASAHVPAANPFVGGAPTAAVPPLPGAPSPFGGQPANPFGGAPANPFGGADAYAYNNPFGAAPSATHDDVPADAPEGSYTYTLVKSAPDVPVEEVEDPRISSVEVMILWDTTALYVRHLTPPRSFYVGEEQSKTFTCDYFIPTEKLGTTRAPIVLADRGGAVNAVLLPRATGTIEIPGQAKITLQQAIEQGRAQPCSELSGAYHRAPPRIQKRRSSSAAWCSRSRRATPVA